MSDIHISPKKADIWRRISMLLSEAHSRVEEARSLLLLDLHITEGKAVEVTDAAAEALAGQGYMFVPQSEWTGGDSSDPDNFKWRKPHIAG